MDKVKIDKGVKGLKARVEYSMMHADKKSVACRGRFDEQPIEWAGLLVNIIV